MTLVLATDGTPLVSLEGGLWNPQTRTMLVPVFDVGKAAQLAKTGVPVYGQPPLTNAGTAQLVLLSPAQILAPRTPTAL